jgi:hypothetical protein
VLMGHTDGTRADRRDHRHRGAIGPVLTGLCTIASIAGLAACGSSSTTTVTRTATSNRSGSAATTTASSPSTTASTMTKAQAAQAYLSAVGPANAALKQFEKKAGGWNDSTTASEVQAAADPVVKAARQYQQGVIALARSYPPAAADLKALVTADAPFVADLSTASTLNALNASSWVQQLARDANNATTAANIVRSDLGLPPAS